MNGPSTPSLQGLPEKEDNSKHRLEISEDLEEFHSLGTFVLRWRVPLLLRLALVVDRPLADRSLLLETTWGCAIKGDELEDVPVLRQKEEQIDGHRSKLEDPVNIFNFL